MIFLPVETKVGDFFRPKVCARCSEWEYRFTKERAEPAADGGDSGEPVALRPETITGQAFADLASAVAEATERRNRELDPTKIVEITVKSAKDME